MTRRFALALLGAAVLAGPLNAQLWQQAEVLRTAHGVPHIRADNLTAAGYALAWMQLEDHGPRTALGVLRTSGRMGMLFGADSIDADFASHFARQRLAETWHLLEQDTRDIYDGFAAGINRFVELHPELFPPGMPRDFTGRDVAARDVNVATPDRGRAFVARLRRSGDNASEAPHPDEGSNAWAIAPSRTRSGNAMLLRNPHLAWTAGYYEAHVTVPGKLDFYGDFRIGGPFVVISGFNRDLGWATTNNNQDLDEVYALTADPARPDHYLIDGVSRPLRHELVTLPFRNGDAASTITREYWWTPYGPVIHREDGKVYVLKVAGDGEYRSGEQFLKMMRATSLHEWRDAMKIRARMTSNFTYADRAGNIHYVWNAALPLLPHAPGGDSVAIEVSRSEQIWSRLVPYDSLPQLTNPRGGYVHQENSSHHFTNLNQPYDTVNAYPNFEAPSLSLRSQLGLDLVSGRDRIDLAEMIRRKHSYRMMLAERLKPDLIAAVRRAGAGDSLAEAVALLEKWDNTAAPESRGALLFEAWWQAYSRGLPDSLRFVRTWTAADPVATPSGIRNPERAIASLAVAAREVASRWGSIDVAWGEVHRVRRGEVDVPVGGCSGALGCFRTLSFAEAEDGKRIASVGDAWVLAVEFADTPVAYSVLAYGQSPDPASPWHADQAALFARGELKRVAFTRADVDRQAVSRFRPGEIRVR
jgi:acyl-homoserine-lactone acylase